MSKEILPQAQEGSYVNSPIEKLKTKKKPDPTFCSIPTTWYYKIGGFLVKWEGGFTALQVGLSNGQWSMVKDQFYPKSRPLPSPRLTMKCLRVVRLTLLSFSSSFSSPASQPASQTARHLWLWIWIWELIPNPPSLIEGKLTKQRGSDFECLPANFQQNRF